MEVVTLYCLQDPLFHHIQSFDYRFCWSGCPHTFRLLFTWIRVHAQHCQLHFSHSSIAFSVTIAPSLYFVPLPLVDVSKRLHNAMIVSIVDFPSSKTYIPLAISAGVGPTSPFASLEDWLVWLCEASTVAVLPLSLGSGRGGLLRSHTPPPHMPKAQEFSSEARATFFGRGSVF